MANHSSILASRIPWTEEPGGLHPWGHKWSETTESFILLIQLNVEEVDRRESREMAWRRGEEERFRVGGGGSLRGNNPRGCKESNMTEQLSLSLSLYCDPF